jgi:tetratricopeptide (TPR) repeat protein
MRSLLILSFFLLFSPVLPDSLSVLLEKNTNTDRERGMALSQVVLYHFQNGEYDKAAPHVNEIAELSELLDDSYLENLARYYYGFMTMYGNPQGDPFPFLYEARRGAAMLRDTDDNLRLKIKTNSLLGLYYFDRQMPSEAYQCYQEGLEINRRLNDRELEYTLKSNIAALFVFMERYNDALDISLKLLDEPMLPAHNKYRILINISLDYIYLEQYDKALSYLDSASVYSQGTVHDAQILLWQGNAFNEAGQYELSVSKLEACLDSLGNHPYPSLETQALLLLTNAHLALGNDDSVLKYSEKVIQKSREYEYLIYETDGYMLKAIALYNNRRYKEGYESLRQAVSHSDSIKNQNNSERLNEIIFLEKMKEMEEHSKMEVMMIEAKHRQQTIFYIFTGLILAAVVVIVLLLLNRKNILLRDKKNQEESLSKELDLRNREITAKVLLQVQRKEMLIDTINKLTELKSKKRKTAESLEEIINEMRHSLSVDSPEDFDYYFVQIHPDFYNRLRADYPNLTPYEQRLCAYLKLNLSTKDIASICNISPDSAKIARSRLRHSLGIQNTDDDLVGFLTKY